MSEERKRRILDMDKVTAYLLHLREQEHSLATIQKYNHDLGEAVQYFCGAELTKAALIEWKEYLKEKYAATSVNGILAAFNGFLKFMAWLDLCVKPLKIQKAMFCDQSRELTYEEYVRLVNAAKNAGNIRLSLVVQTICSTGIRVSELRFITVEAVQVGRAVIDNKGKCRTILLPTKLCKRLSKFAAESELTHGPVFVTRFGKPLDRSNIWRDMKKLCESAHVEPGKVFPHNLRHLFARRYFSLEKDLSRLADILGHSSVDTTRIYTMESGTVHAKQLERLGLIIT